jgi:demethylmenaquinone methyltransferase/2-methoxy-6-polyprenyl-1,4-benzoquinol methylase
MTTATTSPPPADRATDAGVDKSSDRVRRMFGQIAGRYDLMNHVLSLGIDHYWRWRTVRIVPPRGNQPILDLCTGTGDLALAYDKAAAGRVQVVGADFCHEMLAIADRKCGGRVRIVEADAQNLPLADNQFQIVSVAFGLRNVSDTDRGLAEMVRVCAPAGRVAVLEFTSPRWQPLKAMYGWYFRNVLPRIGQLVARNSESAYEYLPASVGQFPQYEQLVERMQAAGLANVRFVPFTFGVATLYVGEKSGQ